MRINHNISSMQSQGSLFNANRAMNKSLHRLSTGLRINSAVDDAAGLGVAENLRSQVRGMHQAIKNSQDAIALLNIADGALNEQSSILQRMRELVIQAKNDTYTTTERKYMGDEFEALGWELDRIAKVTNYNGMRIFGWFGGTFSQNISGTPHAVLTGTNIWDSAADNVLGADDNGTSHHFNMQVGANYSSNDGTAYNSSYQSYDKNAENVVTIQMGQMDARGILSKNKVFANPIMVLNNQGTSNIFEYGSITDPLNFTGIQDKLNYIQQLIDGEAGSTGGAAVFNGTNTTGLARVNEMRAYIGATINRLESNINNLMVGETAQQSAESVIRDADFASESATFTRNQILTQSATSMLAQANMSQQGMLQLLQ